MILDDWKPFRARECVSIKSYDLEYKVILHKTGMPRKKLWPLEPGIDFSFYDESPPWGCEDDSIFENIIDNCDNESSFFVLELVSEEVSRNLKRNDKKFEASISRARAKVMEYALCNDFDWYVTLTLSSAKYDRYNLDKFKSDLTRMIRKERERKGYDIQFLLVPEPHKDGAWHIHGFFSGIPFEELRLFKISDNIPIRLKDKISRGEEIYDFPRYSEKFGWCLFERVQNRKAAARYILEYITKDLCNSEVGRHLYIPSRGLKKAELIYRGYDQFLLDSDYMFENAWVKINWFDEKIFKNFVQKGIDKLKSIEL